MATLRTVTKNTFFYTFSSVLQRASSIVFFPIFSYYLTKGDYGIQSIVTYVLMFSNILCGLQLLPTATRLIHDDEDYEARIKDVYGSYFLLIFTMNALVAAVMLVIGPWVMKPFLNDISFYPFIAITLTTLPFVATYLVFKNYLQATHQGARFVRMDLLYFACNVGFNLLFVTVFKMGVKGILISSLISSTTFSSYAYFSFLRKTSLRFNKKILREGLHFSLPLVPFALLGVLLDSADKLVLNAKMGKDAGGLLYIASMMAAMFTVLRESTYQAIIPWFYQQYEKLPQAYTRRVLYAAFGGMSILAVCISLFSHELLVLLSSNDELIQSFRYTPIIVNTALVVFLGQLLNMGVMYFKRNARYLFLTTLIGLPVNIALSFLLIDQLGIYGAAISNFTAMSAMTVVSAWLSHRSGFKLNYFYLVTACACSLALSFVALLPVNFWMLLALKAAIAATLFGGFYIYVSRHFPVNALIRDRLQPMASLLQRIR